MLAAASGCASLVGLDDVRIAGTDAGPDASTDTPVPTCNGTITMPMNEGAAHVTDFSPVTYIANPPTSGTHYDGWARWDRVYADAVPQGFWVHNLEHGGIVFLYSCTDCQPEVDQLAAVMASMPPDEDCVAPITRRALVTPDPLIAVRIAAVAWDVSYTAGCVNEPELRAFAAAHSGFGPEPQQCQEGQFPTSVAP
jgi:hypothetical protein